MAGEVCKPFQFPSRGEVLNQSVFEDFLLMVVVCLGDVDELTRR